MKQKEEKKGSTKRKFKERNRRYREDPMEILDSKNIMKMRSSANGFNGIREGTGEGVSDMEKKAVDLI